MSGAEALVAVGLASNILQFVDFTIKLCQRIRTYRSTIGALPQSLDDQAARLSNLLQTLRTLTASSRQQALDDGALQHCQAQASELSSILESLRGDIGDKESLWKSTRKAVASFKQSEKIHRLESLLDRLVSTLSLQLQVETR